MNRIEVSAPSNIALVKYMGKKDDRLNIPANPSLSMTLENARTTVILDRQESESFELVEEKLPDLSDHGREKLFRHVDFLRQAAGDFLPSFGLEFSDRYRIQFKSENNFPTSAGMASSASSFAALTVGLLAAFSKDSDKFKNNWNEEENFRLAISQVSRRGSGSSCRSFLPGFVSWRDDEIFNIQSDLELVDLVVMVSRNAKKVSSSEAHRRILSSPLWNHRVERVEERITQIQNALENARWGQLSKEVWKEAWEMHSLFHTSEQPFTYFHPDTIRLLDFLEPHVGLDDGVCPTLDAGPNVHVIVQKNRAEKWKARLKQAFPELDVWEDRLGQGIRLS